MSERRVWLVGGWPATDVEGDPRIRQLDDRGLTRLDGFLAEHLGVEAARALDILGDEEMGQQEAFARAE